MRMSELLPSGIVKLNEYSKRFKSIGLPGRYAFSREKRFCLEMSMLYYCPREYFAKIKTVIDVGANQGDWAKSISTLLKPEKIICYEPVSSTFEQLRRNVESKNINCRRCAVGSTNGKINIHVEKVHQMSSLLNMNQQKDFMEWGMNLGLKKLIWLD